MAKSNKNKTEEDSTQTDEQTPNETVSAVDPANEGADRTVYDVNETGRKWLEEQKVPRVNWGGFIKYLGENGITNVAKDEIKKHWQEYVKGK